MASSWTIAKDSAAFAATLLILTPWLRDFGGRWRLSRMKAVETDMEAMRNIRNAWDKWLASAKTVDLVLTSMGLVLLSGSYLIALLQSLGAIPA